MRPQGRRASKFTISQAAIFTEYVDWAPKIHQRFSPITHSDMRERSYRWRLGPQPSAPGALGRAALVGGAAAGGEDADQGKFAGMKRRRNACIAARSRFPQPIGPTHPFGINFVGVARDVGGPLFRLAEGLPLFSLLSPRERTKARAPSKGRQPVPIAIATAHQARIGAPCQDRAALCPSQAAIAQPNAPARPRAKCGA
jgi:hypothetical protein